MQARRLIGRWIVIVVLLLLLLLGIQRLPIGQYLNLALSPLLSVLQVPGQWWNEQALWLYDKASLQAELYRSQRELEKQAALIQQAASLREENLQLRQLLKITDVEGFTWRAAQVLGRSPDKKSQRLVVQAQANEDNVVVSSSGLVGIIDKSYAQYAVVRTILDASLAVPVTINDSPLAALIRGQGDHLLVDFIPLVQAPEVGAVLQTSGAGGVFPPGIPVAYITHVEALPGNVFARIQAKPIAHWRRDSWLAIAARIQISQP
ncbi:MAG: rod shape-determining protein MreC [Mariprofundaceae bacterium]